MTGGNAIWLWKAKPRTQHGSRKGFSSRHFIFPRLENIVTVDESTSMHLANCKWSSRPGICFCRFSEKHFESLSLCRFFTSKGFREKNQELQLRLTKKSRNYLLFVFRQKNFTCRRVDAFLGSDENKFHNDENSQRSNAPSSAVCILK